MGEARCEGGNGYGGCERQGGGGGQKGGPGGREEEGQGEGRGSEEISRLYDVRGQEVCLYACLR